MKKESQHFHSRISSILLDTDELIKDILKAEILGLSKEYLAYLKFNLISAIYWQIKAEKLEVKRKETETSL